MEPGDLARADVLNHMGSGTGNAIILVCQLGSIFSLQVSVLFILHCHVTSQTGQTFLITWAVAVAVAMISYSCVD